MSQPFDRGAAVPSPRKPDEKLGEFWVDSPWSISASGHNLSGYERNRVYLNVSATGADQGFVDVSAVTSADSDGDGRAALALDSNGDGRRDLLVRQVGGGPLILFENQLPGDAHWLAVTLRGTDSNSQGIGARIVATLGPEASPRQVVREMFPPNGFNSGGERRIHLGLGPDDTVRTLEIRWPSGHVQTLSDVKGDRHVRVTEGKTTLEERPAG